MAILKSVDFGVKKLYFIVLFTIVVYLIHFLVYVYLYIVEQRWAANCFV